MGSPLNWSQYPADNIQAENMVAMLGKLRAVYVTRDHEDSNVAYCS